MFKFLYLIIIFLIGTTDEGVLKQYYYDAFGRIRQFSTCLLVVAPLLNQQSSDASDWSHFMPPPHFHGIRHEWHRYQIWGYEVSEQLNHYFAYSCFIGLG
jgi:hypothetical protein